MSWVNFFDKIFVINLTKRTDRLLYITEHFEKYEIPFTRISAIENGNGAEGLRDTMLMIFNECIEDNYANTIIFEDDAEFVLSKQIVDDIMEKVIKQLPENYYMLFLGGQPSAGYSNFYSNNLLPAIKYFSTHSVAYSLQGIKEIMIRGMDYPIDNWYVSTIQTLGNCYAVDPLLCSQRPGYSDIGKNDIDWNPFIVQKHREEINKLHARR